MSLGPSPAWILTGEYNSIADWTQKLSSQDQRRLKSIIGAAVQATTQFFGVELSRAAAAYLGEQIESILEEQPIQTVQLAEDESDRVRTEIAIRNTLKRFFSEAVRNKASDKASARFSSEEQQHSQKEY